MKQCLSPAPGKELNSARPRLAPSQAYNERMSTVGLISDTHGRLSLKAYEALADCDFIIHAGDICNPQIIRDLKTLAPVFAVLGNNDYDEYGQDIGRFCRPVIDGVKFLVAHYPRDVRISAFGSSAVPPGSPIPDVCVHGHTHVPRLEWGKEARPASYIVNPGSATLPRGGFQRSVGKIEIENAAIRSIRIESLSGEIIMHVGDL